LLLLVVFGAWPGPGPLHAEEDPEELERRSLIALIEPRPGEVIADVGCGTGRWTFPLARAVGANGRVYAVDIDPKKIEAVRRRVVGEGARNVEVIHSLPDDPMLPPDALDAVFLNNVIDHVDRPALAGFLDGIRQALKPAGRLLIRDPHGNPDRVIAECYRAGFTLVKAAIPLTDVPQEVFSSTWYALTFRRGEQMQPAILPRLGKPERRRMRLHLAEELFRASLLSREELRGLWESIQNAPGAFDPAVDEARDLLAAARAVGVVDEAMEAEIRTRIESR
jgi:ubiquinone/menaquinone biosynthesis C-methylase UbiE